MHCAEWLKYVAKLHFSEGPTYFATPLGCIIVDGRWTIMKVDWIFKNCSLLFTQGWKRKFFISIAWQFYFRRQNVPLVRNWFSSMTPLNTVFNILRDREWNEITALIVDYCIFFRRQSKVKFGLNQSGQRSTSGGWSFFDESASLPQKVKTILPQQGSFGR